MKTRPGLEALRSKANFNHEMCAYIDKSAVPFDTL